MDCLFDELLNIYQESGFQAVIDATDTKLVVLNGVPGAGKTTISRSLAEYLSCPTINGDEAVGRAHMHTIGRSRENYQIHEYPEFFFKSEAEDENFVGEHLDHLKDITNNKAIELVLEQIALQGGNGIIIFEFANANQMEDIWNSAHIRGNIDILKEESVKNIMNRDNTSEAVAVARFEAFDSRMERKDDITFWINNQKNEETDTIIFALSQWLLDYLDISENQYLENAHDYSLD